MGQNELVESKNEITISPEALESFSSWVDYMIENDARKYEVKTKNDTIKYGMRIQGDVKKLEHVTKIETERIKGILKHTDDYYKTVENIIKEYRMNMERIEKLIANAPDGIIRDVYIKSYERMHDVMNQQLLNVGGTSIKFIDKIREKIKIPK